jgi:uncharacterized protein (DUF1330 family)
MKTNYKMAIALVAGAVIGATAIQGLYAQAKPKAYLVTETEILDAAALDTYTPLVRAALKAAGGRSIAPPEGKTVPLVGEAPKRVGISEWDNLEQAQAYRNSEAYKNLAPQRDKALKTIRAYIKEGSAN